MKAQKRIISVFLCLILVFCSLPSSSFARGGDAYNWVGSWSTSPVKAGVKVAGIRMMDFLRNRTVRSVVQLTLGGDALRVRVSNIHGESPLKIEAASLGRTDLQDEAKILAGSRQTLTFNGGQSSVTVPVGEYIYSDPVKIKVLALEKISISYYINQFTNISTAGFYGGTAYVGSGNQINSDSMSRATPLLFSSGSMTFHTIPFLTNIDVNAPTGAYSVVFFGDSTITNQAPYYMAEKLVENGIKNIGVLQQAIVANRLLYSGEDVSFMGLLYGEAGIDRFQHDVLSQAGVKKVFVKIGLNDVIHPITKSMEGKAPRSSTQEIIKGYEKLISMARKAGIEIYFFYRTAWKGYSRDFALAPSDDLEWNINAEGVLQNLNEWARTSRDIDGYIDADSLRDPKDFYKLQAAYTTDGAHLSDLGVRALVDCVPMSFFNVRNQSIKSITRIYNEGQGGKTYSAHVPLPPGLSDPEPVGPSEPAENQNQQRPSTTDPLGDETGEAAEDVSGEDASIEYTTRVIPIAYGVASPADGGAALEDSAQGLGKKALGAVMLVFIAFLASGSTWIFIINRRKDKRRPDSLAE